MRLRSICTSTTSPSIISVSSLILTPILRRNACVRASVFDMDKENTSEAAIIVKGTSFPSVWAMPAKKRHLSCQLFHSRFADRVPKDDKTAIPRAIAVFPVEGGPANNIARPAILPSCTIFRIIPAALRAFACPTIPCEFARGSSRSSKPKPRI